MQTRHLWALARAGDREARDRLIEQHMPLARSLAVQYRHAREPLDDLCQVANLGLIKAVDRFDPSRGIAFTSYAVPTILGELKRHFRDRTWAVRVPRDLQELVLKVDGAVSELGRELHRAPKVHEIAQRLSVGYKAAESLLTRARDAFREAFTLLDAGEPADAERRPARPEEL